MNKKLMAVAVAGAIGAPGLAFAQAANVTIYGVLTGGVDSMKYTSSTLTPGATVAQGVTKQHVTFGAPRWGLRGSEDLGGGMTAFFQMESGTTMDGRGAVSDTQGVNIMGGRDSYLGLRGTAWGEVKFGGFGTAYKGLQGVWTTQGAIATGHGGIIMGNGDTTGRNPSPNCIGVITPGGVGPTAGTAASPSCQPQVEGNGTSFSRRASNYVEYASPNMSGFVLKIGTALGEEEEAGNYTATGGAAAGLASSDPNLWSYSVVWAGGPWTVGGAYEQHQGFRATNTALTQRNAKDTGWTLGLRYNFGVGDIGVGYERLDYENAATAAASNAFKLDNWVINGSWKITPAGTIAGGYSKTGGAKSCGAGLTDAAGSCGSATEAKAWSLNYDHALSKRTSLFAAYSKIDNNGNTAGGATYYYIAGPTSNNGGGTVGGLQAGSDVTSYGVGVKHTF